jgi:uncharacterized protein YbjT (DUF2867 family)
VITVFGATGRLGSEIVLLLRNRGEAVRAVSREGARLAQALALGAEGCVADLRRPETLAAALKNTRVLVITANAVLGRGTNDLQRVDVEGHASLVEAAQRLGVERVVFASAMGADPRHPVDLFRAKASTEARLEESGMGGALLRAAPFMEAWLGPLAAQVSRGEGAVLIGRGDNPIPFVARGDVAKVAVDAALDLAHPAMQKIAIGGPERISLAEVAELAGRLANRRPGIRRKSSLRVLASSAVARTFDPVRARLLRTALWLDEADHPPTPPEVLSRHGPFRSVRSFLESSLSRSPS